jgi:hypothetical protein
MLPTARRSSLPLAAVSLLLLGAGRLTADTVVASPPGVASYSPPPAAPCYGPPVAYTPAPAASYYYAPPASYSYYAPAVSYYPPSVPYYAAPAAVTTTRYGLFGRPRASTTYYPPGYVGP